MKNKIKMKTIETQKEAFRLLNLAQKELVELIEELEYSESVPAQHLVIEIKSFLLKHDSIDDVFNDCNDFVERIKNTYVSSNDKECPMSNLINRLTTTYPLVSSKLDTNVDFGEKVPNIFQQYQHAFKEYGITMDTWHSKNDTYYYVLEHKDGDVYNSENESNYEFKQTAQMACIEKAFEVCNKKIFELLPYIGNTENQSIN